MWLVAAKMDSTDIEHFHCHRKLFCAALVCIWSWVVFMNGYICKNSSNCALKTCPFRSHYMKNNEYCFWNMKIIWKTYILQSHKLVEGMVCLVRNDRTSVLCTFPVVAMSYGGNKYKGDNNSVRQSQRRQEVRRLRLREGNKLPRVTELFWHILLCSVVMEGVCLFPVQDYFDLQ